LSLWFRGYPDVRGSFTGSDPYTMKGSGWDIWEQSDGFHYAYRQVGAPNNTWRIMVRVDSVGNTDPWAKAGVMVRRTLDPGSEHISLFITPENGTIFEWRDVADSNTLEVHDSNLAAPRWLRLMRVSTTRMVIAQHANDVTGPWKSLDAFEDLYGVFIAPMYMGLAVTSHSESELCTAGFTGLTMEAPTGTDIGDPTAHNDIGIPYNDPEPMYVILEDSEGDGTAYYENKDPNATQKSSWTHWGIELDEFSAQDVNLADVQRMYIGLGDPNNPTQGGTGTVFIDDIRLYAPGCTLSSRSADFAQADYAPEGDPAGDCVVDYREIDVMGRDWLQSPPPNQDVDLYDDEVINFKDLAVLAEFWLEEQISLWP
jgi:hypothetical protein